MTILNAAVMGTEISKSRFKARALEIFRRVETTGEPVIITDHGIPALIVKRYTASPDILRQRLKGSVTHYDDPFGPVGEDDWRSLG
jgi:antitoxin (DNA-binding transcriptional repressor) of toxin-antitoxin stability system